MMQQSFTKTVSSLTDTGMRVMLVTCLAFAGLTAMFNPWLSLGEVAALVGVCLVLRASAARRRSALLSYLDTVTSDVNCASRQTMIASPLPILILRPDDEEIIWSNSRFLRLTGDKNHIFETKLSALVPNFQTQWLLDGKHLCPEPVQVGERYYLVYGNLVCVEGESEFLATTYWVDITRYAGIDEKYQRSRQVLGIIQVDNYDDLARGLEEGERSALRSEINNHIADWLDPVGGMLCRYSRDHYLFLLETGSLQELQRKKFAILDDIRRVQSPNGVAATLSIGLGLSAPDPKTLFQYASLALDMALSRGGDQVVLKNGDSFSFVGGRSKEVERRTKVKSRVVASALSELMAGTQQVLIMGHKFPDLDVVGAVAGVCALARKRGVSVHAVKAPGPYPAQDMARSLMALPEYKGVFLPAEELRHLAGPNTLLVVVDTNRPEQTQDPELLKTGARVAVIDHHRRAASYIENPALSFHDPYASSASELVTELVQYALDSGDLLRTEAEALLSGIVLDTKSFTMRTGSRTFETAAFLRKSGADINQVNRHFQNGLEDTLQKYSIIQSAQTYRDNIAIASTAAKVERIIAAQAADELLKIAGVDASFVLFAEAGQLYLSARSRGDVNVQVICEMLGGGGNAATAGAQFPGQTMEQVLPALTGAIDQYFDEDS